jgi:hypothetical protein
MPIAFTCPHCGCHTDVAEQYAGQSGPCAQCGQTVTVPLAGGAGSSPPPKRSGWFPVLLVLGVLGGIFVLGGILAFLLLPLALARAPKAAQRARCGNNLRQIALAMVAYHDTYKTFPPAYVADKDGRPMHSWRTLLLPFVADEALAARYNFDEPWDSPGNRQVTDTCIPEYQCPSDVADGVTSNETNYVMIVGPGMFSDGTSSNHMFQISDGFSYTIMIVEVVGSKIAWAEPRDLEADKITFKINDPQTLGISSRHSGGANCVLIDSSVVFASDSSDPGKIQAMCTIAGGETVDPAKLNP